MSDSYVQLQVPLGPVRPPWAASSRNRVWDDVLEEFSQGWMEWDETRGFVARLFDTNWLPDFTVQTYVDTVPPDVWITDPVALQDVARRDGYCMCSGIRFPQVESSRQLGGVAIYEGSGRMIWAALDWFGNLPVLQQDVYIVWPENFGGPFKL